MEETREDTAWITRQRAAELTGLSLRQLHRYVRAGKILIHRESGTGRVAYRESDVLALGGE